MGSKLIYELPYQKEGGIIVITDYKNKDKRNTDSHMRTHSTEEEYRYECDKCGKKMHFSTQYKRHRSKVVTFSLELITCGNYVVVKIIVV